jgi:hypothetical protein
MAKGKKKKNKKNSFYKAIKPFISDNRVLFSILGAAGVGVALASAFGTEKGREIVDKIAGSVRDFTQGASASASPETASKSNSRTSAKQPA